MVIPVIKDDMPDALKSALAIRNQATVTGECSCGARIVLRGAALHMEHEYECLGSDDALRDLAKADPLIGAMMATVSMQTVMVDF